jgi:hypothetical protein
MTKLQEPLFPESNEGHIIRNNPVLRMDNLSYHFLVPAYDARYAILPMLSIKSKFANILHNVFPMIN